MPDRLVRQTPGQGLQAALADLQRLARLVPRIFMAWSATQATCGGRVLYARWSVHPQWVSLAGASASTMSCAQAHTVGRRERSADGVSARTACRGRAKTRSRADLDFHELGGPCIQRLPHPAPRADRLSLCDPVLRPCLQPGYRRSGRLGMDLCGPRLYLRHRALGRRRCDWSAALCEGIAPFMPRTLARTARNWLPSLTTIPWPVRTRADPPQHSSPRPTRVGGCFMPARSDVVPLGELEAQDPSRGSPGPHAADAGSAPGAGRWGGSLR